MVVTGTLVPRDEILVTPEIDGYRITDVLVEEGARVERGQVLSRLSHDLIDRQIAQQRANIDKASAAVPQAENNIEQAEAAETEARLGFERANQLMQSGNTTAVTIEARTSALRQAEGRTAFARNGLVSAKADLEQAKAVGDELVGAFEAERASVWPLRPARYCSPPGGLQPKPCRSFLLLAIVGATGETVATRLTTFGASHL